MENNYFNIPPLVIGDIKAKLPIVQGGMGIGISGVSLATAVANEGGIGVISAVGLGFDTPGFRDNPNDTSVRELRNEIKKARKLTNGVLGVNIMVALSNFSELAKTAIEENIDIIFAGAGLPLDLPSFLTSESKTKLVPIVSSGRAARVLLHKWISKFNYVPDAFVVEGPLAGGHLGFKKEQIENEEYSLENIIMQVITEVCEYEKTSGKKIPVIAAGGIYDGEDIFHFLELGANGVQMGTRFVMTEECDASAEFKKSYADCKKEDIVIIESPVGLPGRAIRNTFIESVKNGKVNPVNCPYHCIKTCNMEKSPYCIAVALLNAKKGNMKNGFAFAGQNAYRTKKIISVHELIESLKTEYYNHINLNTNVFIN